MGSTNSSNTVQYTPLPGAGYSASTPGAQRHGRDPNYPSPANWSSPSVSPQNLVADTGALRKVSTGILHLSDTINGALKEWEGPATAAAASVGAWPAARQLSDAISRTAAGVKSFVGELADVHSAIAGTISGAADSYDDSEQSNTQVVKQVQRQIAQGASAASGWSVAAGGVTQHVNPFYGDHLSPQAQATAQHMISMQGGAASQPVWNGQYDITSKQVKQSGVTFTQDVSFQPDNTYKGMDYAQINSMIQQTDPETVYNAVGAYGKLVGVLTDATGQLANHAKTVAENWGGSNAVTAVSHIQMLHQTATDLQANTYQAGEALNYYAPQLAAAKGSPTAAPVIPPGTTSGAAAGTAVRAPATPTPSPNTSPVAINAVNTANTSAQNQMAALNGHIEAAYNSMPTQLNKNLPPLPKKPAASPAVTGPGGGGIMPGGPGVGSVGGGTGGGTGGTTVPPVTIPKAPGTTLSSAPPGTTTMPGAPGTSAPAPSIPSPSPVPSTPVPTMPGVPGLPGTGTGSTGPLGSEPVPGEGDLPGMPGLTRTVTGLTGAGDPPGVDGAGSTALSGETVPPAEGVGGGMFPGMGGMGGMGGAGGQNGQPRTRQSWESEDESMWEPADEAAFTSGPGMTDGVIGGPGLPGGVASSATAGFAPGGVGGGAGSGTGAAEGMADGAGYPMMGGMGAGGGRRDGSERQRQAWMLEDPDIWDRADQEVPPVIG